MEFIDYYKVLRVESNADLKTIKKSYRQLAHKFHPDINLDKGAEAKFKQVSEAYQVLKDPKLRAEFDELLKYGNRSDKGFQPPPGWKPSNQSTSQDYQSFDGDFSDFFNSIFGAKNQGANQTGSRRPHEMKGQDVEIQLSIFLEDTLKDTQKTLEYIIPTKINGQLQELKKHLKVKIPQGVRDNEKIRLVGQGSPSQQGGAAGDLYLQIRIAPHPFFDVSGNDLLITLPLSPWEAALGTKVTVPTLDGKISLTIPADSSSGKKFRIKGKGLVSKSDRGDLFVIVKLVMPEKSSEKSKVLWKSLASSEDFNPRQTWSVS